MKLFFLKSLEIHLSNALGIPLLCFYPKEEKTEDWTHSYTPMFNVALFIFTKLLSQYKCSPINEWMNEVQLTYGEEKDSSDFVEKLLFKFYFSMITWNSLLPYIMEHYSGFKKKEII